MGGSTSQSKQRYLGIPQRGVLSVILFLVAINGILEELGNGVDGSLFAYDLAIHIITRNQRMTARTLQGWMQRSTEPIEIMLRNKIIRSKVNIQ